MTESASSELEMLNALREKAVEPFARFRSKLKNNDGEGCAKAVFELLSELDTAQRLKELAIYLEDSGESVLALETERLWDTLCSLLDVAAQPLGGTPVKAARFARLFDLMLSTVTL